MKSLVQFWSAGALAAALSLAGCVTPAAPADVRQVVSTTSFGMCAGYCSTRLEISEGRAVLVRNGHGRGVPDLPERRSSVTLQPEEWREIARLAARTDLSALPDTIGCPDCADGGAESLTIVGAGAARTISFDYGAAITQAQPLLERVRALRAKLTPADEGAPTR